MVMFTNFHETFLLKFLQFMIHTYMHISGPLVKCKILEFSIQNSGLHCLL